MRAVGGEERLQLLFGLRILAVAIGFDRRVVLLARAVGEADAGAGDDRRGPSRQAARRREAEPAGAATRRAEPVCAPASSSGALGDVDPSALGEPAASGLAVGSKASPLRAGLATGGTPESSGAAAGTGASGAGGGGAAAAMPPGAPAPAPPPAPPRRNSTSCWKRLIESSSRCCWFSSSSMRPLAWRNSFSSRSMRTVQRAGVARIAPPPVSSRAARQPAPSAPARSGRRD